MSMPEEQGDGPVFSEPRSAPSVITCDGMTVSTQPRPSAPRCLLRGSVGRISSLNCKSTGISLVISHFTLPATTTNASIAADSLLHHRPNWAGSRWWRAPACYHVRPA